MNSVIRIHWTGFAGWECPVTKAVGQFKVAVQLGAELDGMLPEIMQAGEQLVALCGRSRGALA